MGEVDGRNVLTIKRNAVGVQVEIQVDMYARAKREALAALEEAYKRMKAHIEA